MRNGLFAAERATARPTQFTYAFVVLLRTRATHSIILSQGSRFDARARALPLPRN